jgi:hypothetical protein
MGRREEACTWCRRGVKVGVHTKKNTSIIESWGRGTRKEGKGRGGERERLRG